MRRKSPPKPYRVLQALGVLNTLPTDAEPTYEWRHSENGNPNMRMSATTNRVPWMVDIYIGSYYRIQVGDLPGEVQRDLRSVYTYLLKHLGLAS